ncbi:MAG: IclR family transcriptional regulator [Chloroflexota bacterium]
MSRVQVLSRAVTILEVLAGGALGVTEVAERSGLPKSTAARLLTSLAEEGMVERVPGDVRYRIGPYLSLLAGAVRPGLSLGPLARPHLQELAQDLGEAAGLSIPDGFAVHYVDQVESPHPVSVRDWTGTRILMHAVSSGHVFLAHMHPDDLERFLAGPLPPYTARTFTTAAALRERLRKVQLDGYAWTCEEYAEGISSVAAPIVDVEGEVVAAVHVHGPSYRFPVPGQEEQIARRVVEAGLRVSAILRRMARF